MSTCTHHDHDHLPVAAIAAPGHGERAAAIVLALTIVTMLAEIAAGWWTGSMALLADGWHMGMHAAAMGVAVFAYRFARRHAGVGRYAVGAHRAPDLGAFANAVMLAVIAVLVAGESALRLVSPEPIDFSTALIVAVVGLGVNLLSAWLLRDAPHDHGCGHQHRDNNREAAFVHVLSDALTSGLAIVALWCGRQYGLAWLDPLMGLVGAAVILRWSAGQLRRSANALLTADGAPMPERAGECGHHH
ncbi:MAG: cation diffusion facilitator family transporter [Sphingomonas sp.]|nr:cation diffusion facilitator family transporter [Sphingomonas sp.]